MCTFARFAGGVRTRIEAPDGKDSCRLNSSKSEDSSADAPTAPVPTEAGRKGLFLLIAAVLLAVFLGALDALLVGAAMPTIVADLGGLHLYGWVFSSYLLARAIALPIFGKLCDLVSSRKLYVAAIAIFTISSVLCGASTDMRLFIVFRAFQGIGAGEERSPWPTSWCRTSTPPRSVRR